MDHSNGEKNTFPAVILRTIQSAFYILGAGALPSRRSSCFSYPPATHARQMGAPHGVVSSRGCARLKVRDLTTLTITEQSLSGHKHSLRVVEKMRNSQPPRNPVDLHGLPSRGALVPGWSQGCSLELSLQWSSRQLWAPAQGARAPGGNFVEGCSPHARQPPLNSSDMPRGSVQKSATVTSSRAIPSP